MSRALRSLAPVICLTLAAAAAAQAPSGEELPPGAIARLGTLRLRHREAVMSLAFAPDGKTLASASYAGVVRLWDPASGRELQELPKGTGSLVLFTPDGKHLVCSDSEQGLALHEVVTGQKIRTFGNRERGARHLVGGTGNHSVALAPDGKTLAEANGVEVVLWDVATGRELRRCKGHQAPVYCVAFAPDGNLLAAGDGTGRVTIGLPGKGDTTILLWDPASGKEVRRILQAHHGWVMALAFAPDGKTLASASPYDSCLWEVATGKQQHMLATGSRSLAFTADGKLLATPQSGGGAASGTIALWDPATGKPVHQLSGHVTLVHCAAFTPDGKTLATGGPEGTIRLWDTGQGRELIRHDGHQAPIRSVAFSPNGTLAATASGGDHTIRIWGTASGAQLAKIEIPCRSHSHWCSSSHAVGLAFGPDGKTVVCDGHVFDTASGRETAVLPGAALAHSSDGKRAAGPASDRYSSRGGRVVVWDRATGREIASFQPFGKDSYDAQVTAAALSPDGKLLAVGAADRHSSLREGEKPRESVYLYDIAAGKLLHKFRPSGAGPTSLIFSPDGSLLATSATWEQPVQLWRVSNGLEVRKFAGQEENRHWAEHRPIAFSTDGKLLAMGGKESSVVFWEVATGQELHRLTGHRGPVRALAFSTDGRSMLSAGADTAGLIWDLAPPGKKADLAPADLDRLWDQLAADNAGAAYRASWALAGAPARGTGLFKERLRPLPEPNLMRLPDLIKDLDAQQFAVRQAAHEEIKKLGPLAEESLRKTLDSKPPLEIARRVELLLAELHQRPVPVEELRQLRAVQALEWMGTAAAAEVLERLARGSPGLRPTRDAEAALGRLNARRPVPADPKPAAPPRSEPAPAVAPHKLSEEKGETTALAFTASGKTLAAAVGGDVRLWDVAAGKLLHQIKADERGVLAVAFAPDGKILATGGRDGTVRLWDPATSQALHVVEGHGGAVAALAFSPDGKVLASGSLDKTVRLWDVAAGRQLRKLTGHVGQVTSVAFAPDGKTLASADLVAGENQVAGKQLTICWPDAVRVWDVATGNELRQFPAAGHLVAFSPAGVLATASLETELHIGGNAIHLSRSSGSVIGGGQGEAAIKGESAILLWDAATGQSRLRLGGLGAALAFSPDGRFLATARGTDLHHGGKLLDTPGIVAGDGRLRLWEAASGQEVLAFPADARPAVLAFAPDGRTLVAGLKSGGVLLWDLTPRSAARAQADLGAEEFTRLWSALADEDAAAAYRAMAVLHAAGLPAVAHLKERLQPTPADDPKLQQLIGDLAAEGFAQRDAASRELARRGADAEPALCLALQRSASPMVRQRLLALLGTPDITEHPEPLARARAVAVLEAVGSPQAHQVLETLAKGPRLARLTREAQAALERLERRQVSR